jgi:hypothetical protein
MTIADPMGTTTRMMTIVASAGLANATQTID